MATSVHCRRACPSERAKRLNDWQALDRAINLSELNQVGIRAVLAPLCTPCTSESSFHGRAPQLRICGPMCMLAPDGAGVRNIFFVKSSMARWSASGLGGGGWGMVVVVVVVMSTCVPK